MSAQAGTSSPVSDLLSVRSLWLFEILAKGHVCHVRANERPAIPTCFVSVTLSVGCITRSVLFKWAHLQSVKSTAAVQSGSQRDRWTVALSAFLPPHYQHQLCEWQDFNHSPFDGERSHRDVGNPLVQNCCLTCSEWTAIILTHCHCDWITVSTVASGWGVNQIGKNVKPHQWIKKHFVHLSCKKKTKTHFTLI